MARSRATLHTDIWNPNSDFRMRSEGAQRLYFLLLTQGDLSLCGVCPLTIDRWVSMSSDSSVFKTRKALRELVEHRYVVVDESTQELWIRTFTKHDGVLRQPNVIVSMSRDFDAIQSIEIREGFLEGLPEGLVDGSEDGSVQGLPDGYKSRLSRPFLEGVLRTRTRAPTPPPTPTPYMHPSPNPSKRETQNFEAEFDECWNHYPRKEARKAALKAFQAQRRKGTEGPTLLSATRHFAAQMKQEKREQNVIMLGSTFFGPNDRWEDFEKPPIPEYREPVARGAGDMFENEAERDAWYKEHALGEKIVLPGELDE